MRAPHHVAAPSLLQCCTPEVWHAAMAALGRWHEAGSTDFAEGFAQLYDAQLLLAADGQHLELPPALHQRVQRAAGLVRQPATVSAWHKEVSAELRAAGVEHRIEYKPEVGAGAVLQCIMHASQHVTTSVWQPVHAHPASHVYCRTLPCPNEGRRPLTRHCAAR